MQPHLRGATNEDVFNDQAAAAAAAAMKAKNENTKFVGDSTCSVNGKTITCKNGCEMINDEIKCLGESSDEDSGNEENGSISNGTKCMGICMGHSGLDNQAACESEHRENCKCKWDWPTCEPDNE